MQTSGKFERKTGLLHVGTAICLVAAMLLYAASSRSALAFGFLGACFEALAWYQMFVAQRKHDRAEDNH